MGEPWSLIESEPSIIADYMRSMGVLDLTVQEIWDIDMLIKLSEIGHTPRALLCCIPFLDSTINDLVQDNVYDKTAPLWFAQQSIRNSCCTIALMNTVSNIQDLTLEEGTLTKMNSFTKGMTPDIIADVISNSNEIRELHNSYAANDLSIYHTEPLSKDKAATEPAYHYIVYVPRSDPSDPNRHQVYLLDGLSEYPIKLLYSDNDLSMGHWWKAAVDHIKKLSYRDPKFPNYNIMAIHKLSGRNITELRNILIEEISLLQSTKCHEHRENMKNIAQEIKFLKNNDTLFCKAKMYRHQLIPLFLSATKHLLKQGNIEC